MVSCHGAPPVVWFYLILVDLETTTEVLGNEKEVMFIKTA